MRITTSMVLSTFAGAFLFASCVDSPKVERTDTPEQEQAQDGPAADQTPGDDETPGPTDTPPVSNEPPASMETPPAEQPADPGVMEPPAPPAEDPALARRQIDYSEALRTASLKLVGTIPTVDEIVAVRDRATYEAQIDRYLADPRLARRLRTYFRNMMKMGGTIDVTVDGNRMTIDLETAPTFAAMLATSDRSMTELFTASADTCPTLDVNTGAFTPGTCQTSNGIQTSGVLTNPGAMAHMFSNMAFRRTRWVQETFACTKFPAEYSPTPVAMGSAQYTAPWPFESITGGEGSLVNFRDTSSVVCANCHATMNHLAPLFANFDAAGQWQTSIQVNTPTPENPKTELGHWLPADQPLAWRQGKNVTNLTELGQAMAEDPIVMRCQVARTWNWAMSKTDIVEDLAVVPDSTLQALVTSFQASGYKMKPLLRAIFTHDDFVKF